MNEREAFVQEISERPDDDVSRLVFAGGLEVLLRSPYLIRLRELYLRNNPLRAEGVRTLAASPVLAGLTALDLGECQIEDAGAQALADSPGAAGLTSVNLRNNNLGHQA